MLTTTEINNAIDTFKLANVLATTLYIQSKHFGYEDSIKCHKDALNKFNNFVFILEHYDGCTCVNIDEIICEIQNISINYMENCSNKLSREETLNLINLRITQELAPLTAAIGSCFDISGAGDTICDQISANATNISTNSSSISSNTSNIATNTSNIATNTSNISTNTSNISTNTSNISTNTSNISTNTSDISDNASDIVALQADSHPVQDVFIGTTNNSGWTTTIGSANTWTTINFGSAMTASKVNNFSLSGNSTMVYTGTTTKLFLAQYSMSIFTSSTTDPRRIQVGLEKFDRFGGSLGVIGVKDITVDEYDSASGRVGVTGFVPVSLDQDEYLVPVIKNVDDAENLLCHFMNFLVLEIQ